MFPKWYELDALTMEINRRREKVDQELRQSHVERTKIDVEQRKIDEHMAYDVDIQRRARRARELMDEHQMNEAIMSQASTFSLQELLTKRTEISRIRKQNRDMDFYCKEVDEMRRLEEILDDELAMRRKYEHEFLEYN